MPCRSVAWLAVALVLALTVLAASPDLHERLHGHRPGAHHEGGSSGSGQADGGEDGCVVTLFAQGLVLPLVLMVLALAAQALLPPDFDLRDRVTPVAPRYLRLPTQAPPAGLS